MNSRKGLIIGGSVPTVVLGIGVLLGPSSTAAPNDAQPPPAECTNACAGGRLSRTKHAKEPQFISEGMSVDRRGQVLVLYLTAPLPRDTGHFAMISRGKFTPIVGPLGRDFETVALGDAGQVVVTAGNVVCVRSAGKTVIYHGLPGAKISRAGSINDSGDVVGECEFDTPGIKSRATLWRGGRAIALGPADRDSSASAVNNHGQVAGWVAEHNGRMRAVLWDRTGRMTEFGTLGGDTSLAHSLNDSGVVVGEADTTSGDTRAFVWRDGKMSEIGPAGRTSTALGISSDGTVCGFSSDPNDRSRAFIWRAGRLTGLRQPRGAEDSSAFGINSLDQVVGTIRFPDPTGPRAVVWTRGIPHTVQFRVPGRGRRHGRSSGKRR